MGSLYAGAAGAFFVSLVLTPVLRSMGASKGMLDIPNERSSHARPTPRTGGYAILTGIVAGTVVSGAWKDFVVSAGIGGALVLAVVAVVDERTALPRSGRLLIQVAVALTLATAIGWNLSDAASPGSHGMPWWTARAAVATIWIVGLVNAYNFMDGLNGMAGMMSVVAGLSLAVLATMHGAPSLAALATVLAFSAAGFLPFNLITGSVFMGDSGSTTIGLLFAVLVLGLAPDSLFSIAAALPLAPFIFDSGATVVRRAARGERFFATPHRSHYYQWLQQQGWSHWAVAVLYGALATMCSVAGLVFERIPTTYQALLLAGVILVHAVIFAGIQRRHTIQGQLMICRSREHKQLESR